MSNSESHPSLEEPHYVKPHSENRGCLWGLVGCGVLLLLLAIVIGVLSYYAMKNGRVLLADTVVDAVVGSLDQTELPDEQRKMLGEKIRELGESFKEGELTFEKMQSIAERMVDNPTIIAGGILYFIENELLDEAPIDDEMKKRALRAVQRVARGIVEEKIQLEELESLINVLTVQQGNKRVAKSNLSKEDVDKLVKAATEMADEAEVPDEPFEINLAKELDRIVDEELSSSE